MYISLGSHKMRVEIVLLFVVVFWIMFGHLLCSCSTINFTEGLTISTTIGSANKKEGMTGMKNRYIGGNNAASATVFAAQGSPNWFMNPKDWGKVPTQADIAARKPQPIPLPEGELDMFATTDFKPECCPNAYSTGTGCACMTDKQYNYLSERGGNNVPYSEY